MSDRLHAVPMYMLDEHPTVGMHLVEETAVLLGHDNVIARHLTARCEWWVDS